jgi:polyisoprenoid-binding protein YceI
MNVAFLAVMAAAVLAPPSPGPVAPAPTPLPYSIDAAHSHVGFSIRHLGLSRVRGSFAEVSGSLVWDPADPTNGSITVVIGAASLDTRNERRDDDLRENFFETGEFPRIVFQSTGVERGPEGLVIHGVLRLKDVSRPVTLKTRTIGEWAEYTSADRRVGFEAGLVIDRRDFGVRAEGHPAEMRLVIGYEVEIEIEIEALLPGYADTGYPGGEASAARRLDEAVASRPDLDLEARWEELRASPDSLDYSARALALLGFKLLNRGNARAAVQAFSLYQAESEAPAPTTFEWLGHALAAAGRDADAAASYRRALEMDPTRVGSIEMLRLVEGGGARGRWTVPDEALAPPDSG